MHVKIMYNKPHLFKNVFQYQMAKFNNAKPKLFLHQPNIPNIKWETIPLNPSSVSYM